MAQLVARTAGGREVASSSLVIPTIVIMNNYESPIDNVIANELAREELIERYLDAYEHSYDSLVAKLKELGARLVFDDSER